MAFWISLSAVAVVLAILTAAKLRPPPAHVESPESDLPPAGSE